jgi:uncharacterized protein (UPF0335 family)
MSEAAAPETTTTSTQTKKTKKVKEEVVPLGRAQLILALEKIENYSVKIADLESELADYYKFLKEKGVDVKVLKQVARIWASDDSEKFEEYWELFQSKE